MTSGLVGYGAYKSRTDPVHLFWDLDHTILCSITPLPAADADADAAPGGAAMPPAPPGLDFFDQIDDDFPYDPEAPAPNTRTFWRPGARSALTLCSCFAVMHIYTAAQKTYTTNVLNDLDPDGRLFSTRVIDRDDRPQIVKEGKDLRAGTSGMRRAILFDDKVKNFEPQNHENGVAVVPFTTARVAECKEWDGYLQEVKEMSRLVGIGFWSSVHFSGDVRKVVARVRGWRDA